MNTEHIQSILAEYDQYHALYVSFTDAIKSLAINLLHVHDISVHAITGRTKERHSLEVKLKKPSRDYRKMIDITNISGVRIITMFHDDLDIIAQLIEREFSVDAENSSDKRKLLDPDRFGYLSLHCVVSLSPSRVVLPEYQRFNQMKAEIQIRSILQHAWAEIEHGIAACVGGNRARPRL